MYLRKLPQSVPRGYIAVVTAIILSVVLTSLVFAESMGAFWARDDQSNNIDQMQSSAVAESCAYEALLQLQENLTPLSQPETIFITLSESCVIDGITTQNSMISIKTYAHYGTTYSQVLVHAKRDSLSGKLSIISWQE